MLENFISMTEDIARIFTRDILRDWLLCSGPGGHRDLLESGSRLERGTVLLLAVSASCLDTPYHVSPPCAARVTL